MFLQGDKVSIANFYRLHTSPTVTAGHNGKLSVGAISRGKNT